MDNKNKEKKPNKSGSNKPGEQRSVYADRKKKEDRRRKRLGAQQKGEVQEYEQRIVDIARVTRVMAGGKRMRFRACVAIGNKKGKVGIGMAKGADVTLAVTKAVNRAKKDVFDIPIVNDTIPHEIFQKYGAGQVLLKPARQGKGIIAGGAVRTILELSGLKNVTSKNLGTNNKVTIAKCTIRALTNLKKVEKKKETKKQSDDKKKNNNNKPKKKNQDNKEK
jgi:small subunit ribosomal protein S5